MLRIISTLFLALSLSACAFGDETLTLGLTEDVERTGLISEAPSTVFAVSEFVDARPDRKPVGKDETADPKRPYFVGYKRNGYGQNTGNILNETPVAETVQAELEAMLVANGHAVGDGDDAMSLAANVKEFWFDYKTGLITVEFFGTVEAEVTLSDPQTGAPLFSETFVGYHSRKTGGGLSGTWTEVMNAALSDMVRQVSLSIDFKEALENASAPAAEPEANAEPLETAS